MTIALSLLGGAGWQFFDANGAPLDGGKLYVYSAGTTTPLTTYTDSTAGPQNTNPIILTNGYVPHEIWLDTTTSAKFVLKTSADVEIWTKDNVEGAVGYAAFNAFVSSLSGATGSNMIGYGQGGVGALTSGYTVQDKLRQTVSVKDFGAVGDGVADDTAAIQAAIAANSGRVLFFPNGVYKITSRLDFGNVGIEGESVRSNTSSVGGVEFASYVSGDYALTVSSWRGQSYCKFRVKSYASNQSGICVLGTMPIVDQVWVEGFDQVGFRVGTGSLSTIVPHPVGVAAAGCYYAKIDNIFVVNLTATGSNAVRGIFIDGGFPSSNANTFRNVVASGRYDILYEINGTNNSFYGGDCTPYNTVAANTAAYKIGGQNVQIHAPYYEVSVPNYLYWFTSSSFSCEISGVQLQVAVSNVQSKILDEGWANNVSFLPRGFNYAFPQRNESSQNLVVNSQFKSWNPSGFSGACPTGWVASQGTWTQDSSVVRGAAYSVKSTVSNSRCNLQFYIATTSTAASRGPAPRQVPIDDIRGRTLVAAVWCKSSVAGLGNIKISGTPVGSVGANLHSGSGNWELLTVAALIDAAATDVGLQLRSDSDGSNKTGDVWFSEPVCFIGVNLSKEEPRPLTDSMAQMFGPMYLSPFQLVPDLTATPSVVHGNCFTLTNSSATTITNLLTDATKANGQVVYLLPTNANTTLANNASIQTTTNANKALAANTVYKLIHNGAKWFEF